MCALKKEKNVSSLSSMYRERHRIFGVEELCTDCGESREWHREYANVAEMLKEFWSAGKRALVYSDHFFET